MLLGPWTFFRTHIMDWISEHLLQIVIALAAAIAAYLNNRKKEKGGEPADFDGDGIPDNRPGQFERTRMDMEEMERTRKIQEEIRRKIAERRGEGGPVPPFVAPRPVAQPVPELIRRRFEQPTPESVEAARRAAAAKAAREAEALERQRQLEEQMRALEAQRIEAKRKAAAAAVTDALGSMASAGLAAKRTGATDILTDLRAPGGARRAWILREVLGTPAGLK